MVLRVDSRGHRPHVAIVDPNPIIRHGLSTLIPEWEFSAYPSHDVIIETRPAVDVVLLDVRPFGQDGTGVECWVDAISNCHRLGYAVCVYSDERRDHVMLRCLCAGARGLLHKTAATRDLIDTIDQVISGDIATTPEFAHLKAFAEVPSRVPMLTARQAEILAGRARNEPFRHMAHRIGISEKTAQEHWAMIMMKFGRYLAKHSAADLERALGLDNSDQFWHLDDMVS